MDERSITEADMLAFATKNESHFYENKSKGVNGTKIQKTITAFANSDGGELVVGIKDERQEADIHYRWDGFATIEDANYVFQNILEVSPTITHKVEILRAPNNTIALRLYIEKSENVHSTSDGSIYIRKGAQSLKLTDEDKIRSLRYAKGESSYEDTIASGCRAEDIFEAQEMKSFLDAYSPTTDPIDFTIIQNLIDRNTFEPRTAGILIFSDNPIPLLPRRCGIKITRYETDLKTPEREHLKEQYPIEGPLYRQIHSTSDKITEIMQSVKIMDAGELKNARYPPETIWEILVNAVIHRDYSISDDIHILIFNNRIEITSPGRLPGYVTVENILDARFSRNSKIVRMLNKYKDAPNRDMGEGLNTAFQKMNEFRLRSPIIEELENSVRVTVPHTSLASPEDQVMKFLVSHDKIRNREGREITGIRSENSMKRVFYRLRKQNMIEPVMSKTGKKIVAWKKRELK